MNFRIFSCIGLLTLTATCAFQNIPQKLPVDPSGQIAFCIEDAQCQVGLFTVNLSVSPLTEKEGILVGNYVTDVPLFKSKGDHGNIALPISKPLSSIGKEGGTLTGKGYSEKTPGDFSSIVCTIHPLDEKRIELVITTSKRTMHFSSSYELIEIE